MEGREEEEERRTGMQSGAGRRGGGLDVRSRMAGSGKGEKSWRREVVDASTRKCGGQRIVSKVEGRSSTKKGREVY